MKKFNTKKILLATFTATVMALSSGASLSAYAESDANGATFGGNYAMVNMDEYQDYLDTLSDEDRQIIDEKERTDAEYQERVLSGEVYATTRSSTKYGLSRTFTMYQQETDDYCVPACVKSMLIYVTGSSPSQSTIHNSTQYQLTNIPSYVNDRISVTKYLCDENPTATVITARIKRDITEWDIPTFLGIRNHYGINWDYATDGHCILSNGIYDDQETILIADPLGGRLTYLPYFYEKDASAVTTYTTVMVW